MMVSMEVMTVTLRPSGPGCFSIPDGSGRTRVDGADVGRAGRQVDPYLMAGPLLDLAARRVHHPERRRSGARVPLDQPDPATTTVGIHLPVLVRGEHAVPGP